MNYYYEILTSILKLHKLFLIHLKDDLKLHLHDINIPGALILYNLEEKEIITGSLQNCNNYINSNTSYSLSQLTKNNYLIESKSPYDKRAKFVKLSPKGLEFLNLLKEYMEKSNKKILDFPSQEEFILQFTQYLKDFEKLLQKKE